MNFQTANLQPPPYLWTKAEILAHVSPEQVMQKLGLPLDEETATLRSFRFCSPFREDRHPDCKLKYDALGRLFFCDPAQDLYLDWIACVQHAYSLSFPQALLWVADAFNLQPGRLAAADKLDMALALAERVPQAGSVIQIKARPWTAADKAYWAAGNIRERELLAGRVWPISDYWLNSQHRKAGNGAYAYKEDDGYKLYFTQEKGRFRFLSTTKVLSCYELLPQRGSLLLITSSKKDALTLISLGFAAVAPQGEGMDIATHLLLRCQVPRLLLLFSSMYRSQLHHS